MSGAEPAAIRPEGRREIVPLRELVGRELDPLLLEETGYTARSWKRVLKFFASPGFVAEPMTVYWARGLKAGPAQPEDDEVIEQHLIPLSKAVKMVLNGTIRDAKTICSVLWLALNQKKTKGL